MVRLNIDRKKIDIRNNKPQRVSGFLPQDMVLITDCIYHYSVNKLITEDHPYYSVLYADFIDDFNTKRTVSITKFSWNRLKLKSYCLGLDRKQLFYSDDLSDLINKIEISCSVPFIFG